MNGGALAGIRVVDLTTVVVGPTATLFLADYGADVIKVEAPGGDLLRSLGGQSNSGQLSGKFMHFNRNKRSLALDLKRDEGREALHRLLDTADVFIANVRPAALARLGLGGRGLAQPASKADRVQPHGIRARRALPGPPRLRHHHPGPVRRGRHQPAGARRAALRADGVRRPRGRADRHPMHPRRAVCARTQWRRPGDRGADVREHVRLRARRAHGRPHLRAAARAERRRPRPRPPGRSRSPPRTATSAFPPIPTPRPSRCSTRSGGRN